MVVYNKIGQFLQESKFVLASQFFSKCRKELVKICSEVLIDADDAEKQILLKRTFILAYTIMSSC